LGLKVREHRKVQPAIPGVRGVAPDAVHGDAEQRGVEASQDRQEFVIEGQLVAADRTPVRRVKGEDDGAASKLSEREELVRRRVQRKVRRVRAGAEGTRGG